MLFCSRTTWTEQELLLLFRLCNKFEQRFIIVADRYNKIVETKPYSKRTKEELKKEYYKFQLFLFQRRKQKAFCQHRLFSFNINHEVYRLKELETLLTRTNEETEHMAQLTLQRRKIVKALNKHRKDIEMKKRTLREQQTFINSRVSGIPQKALALGSLKGWNSDYGVLIVDNTVKKRDLSVGIFADIPTRVMPKIIATKPEKISSTLTAWNNSIEMRVPCGSQGN
eukprot:UN34026